MALYGAETWTLRATDQKRLESFEVWCWRRMEISWTDHVRNEELLLRVNEQRNILHEIRKRKANWIGHILRRNYVLIIRRSKLFYTASGIITLCRWLSGAQSSLSLCTGRPPTECDGTRCCIIQFWPPDDEHMVLETCSGMKWTYYKTRICALSWLITKTSLLCLLFLWSNIRYRNYFTETGGFLCGLCVHCHTDLHSPQVH